MKEQARNKIAGFVSSSTHRQKIMAALTGGPRTSSQLSGEADMYRSHVSSTLRELEEEDLVECITPERRKGKLFTLTVEGQKVISEISIPDEFFPGSLAGKVSDLFDELAIPYAKNVELKAGGIKVVPDLIAIDDFKPRLLVFINEAYTATGLTDRLQRTAFQATELKKEMKDLKVILVLGGLNKADMLKSPAGNLIGSDYFDAVLHESDLASIREEKPGLEELVDIGRRSEDWPSFSAREGK